MTSRSTDGTDSPLEAHLDLVEQVVRWTCRRRRLSPEDAEELRSIVFLKLIQDDYAVFRKFRGKSSLRTYLTTVVQRLALDFRNQNLGKWRPSAAARRLGRVAVELETLVSRDSRGLEEAIEILRTNHRVGLSSSELERLSTRLPVRYPRRKRVALSAGLSAEQRTDAALWRREGDLCRAGVARKLHRLLAALSGEDRRILELRFKQGLKICQIATRLDLEPRPLYRRIRNCLSGLRDGLEAEGVTRELLARAGPESPP